MEPGPVPGPPYYTRQNGAAKPYLAAQSSVVQYRSSVVEAGADLRQRRGGKGQDDLDALPAEGAYEEAARRFVRDWGAGAPWDTIPDRHRARHRTHLASRTRDDGTTQVVTPTGHVSDESPPF